MQSFLRMVLASVVLAGWAQGQQKSFEDCEISLKDGTLTAKNAQFSASWVLQPSGWNLIALENSDDQTSWVSGAAEEEPISGSEISFEVGKAFVSEATSLSAVVKTGGQPNLHLRLYPNAPGILLRTSVGEPSSAGERATAPSQLFKTFVPNPAKNTMIAATLKAHTDHVHGPLTEELEIQGGAGSSPVSVKSNLVMIHRDNGSALSLLKLAPLPPERTVPSTSDVVWDATSGELTWWGIGLSQEWPQSYEHALIVSENGRAGRIAALQLFQRQIRQYRPGEDGILLSNTWGDGNRDSRITEDFVKKEIAAGKDLGVDVIQVDDGWQKGKSQNSARLKKDEKGIWADFWDHAADFWSTDLERFPGGITELVKVAKGEGLKFGLWYALDSSDNFVNWEKDANLIVDLHRKYDVNYFKFDAIVLSNVESEKRLERLLHRVVEKSDGKISIDLDVTAGKRPGYFGAVRTGQIFVENRYVKRQSYFPYRTLRNFWLLSQYVDPARLRMEFTNNTLNKEGYDKQMAGRYYKKEYGDKKVVPYYYESDYLFAGVMFGTPLAWLELSNLPEDYRQRVKPLIAKWREHREAIHQGSIIPIGAQPDAFSWTGLVSIPQDRKTGYGLFFREINEKGSHDFEVPLIKEGFTAEVLHSNLDDASVTIKGKTATVNLSREKAYVFVKFSR